jgi:hypothetical protein
VSKRIKTVALSTAWIALHAPIYSYALECGCDPHWNDIESFCDTYDSIAVGIIETLEANDRVKKVRFTAKTAILGNLPKPRIFFAENDECALSTISGIEIVVAANAKTSRLTYCNSGYTHHSVGIPWYHRYEECRN